MKDRKERIAFTYLYLQDIFLKSILELENMPPYHEDLDNYAVHYAPDIKRFDLATVKSIILKRNKINTHRYEAGLMFKNGLNFDQDYLMLEVYRLEY